MTWVLIDFETISACDLKPSGAWRYAEDPTTSVLCCGYALEDGPRKLWKPGDPPGEFEILAADERLIIVAHNVQFEKAVWLNHMVPMGFAPIAPSRWHDTMAVCAMKTVPLSLDQACATLRLPVQKDKEGSKLTVSLSRFTKRGYFDLPQAKLDRAYEYCRSDIAAEITLHQRVGWLPTAERRVWLLDQIINQRGVGLDLEYIAAAEHIVSLARLPLEQEFRELTGGIDVGQRDKFMGWIEAEGDRLPNLQKETVTAAVGAILPDEEDDFDEDELPEVSVRSPAVRRALAIRQLVGSTSLKKLTAMSACVCSDGRARGLLQYHGAGPGRWAGRLLQPQNFPRGTLKLGKKVPPPALIVDAILTRDPGYVEMVLGANPLAVVVHGLRHAIHATKGRRLVAGDYAGIEARVVLGLAGQHDKTALMAAGADIYIDMAQDIYKQPVDKERDPEKRQTGKNAVLGLGFQMGWRKFQLRHAKDQPDEFCENVVHTYRKIWAPKVPYLWYALQEASARAVWDRRPQEAYGIEYRLEDIWLTARLPSGRKLWYLYPEQTRDMMPWSTPEEPDIRIGWQYRAKKMGVMRTIHAFGGLLTENVVQATARDIMVDGMFRCEAEGFPIILTVHDEIVSEVEESRADPRMLEEIMGDVAPWTRDLMIPVKAEAWSGDRYKK